MHILKKIASLTDPARPIGRAVFFVLAVMVILLDQASKHWAASVLAPRGRPIPVIPNFWQFHYDENTGAAFSMFSGHTGRLAIFSIAISLILIVWAWRLKPGEQGMRVALGLILGGAIGNIIDRVWRGYVVDFIQWHWMHKAYYPTFNIADSAICVGIALIMIASFRLPSTAKPNADHAQPGKPESRSGSTL